MIVAAKSGTDGAGGGGGGGAKKPCGMHAPNKVAKVSMVQKIIAIDLGFLFILNSYGKIIVLMAGRTGLNISCAHRTFPLPVVKRFYSTEVFSKGNMCKEDKSDCFTQNNNDPDCNAGCINIR